MLKKNKKNTQSGKNSDKRFHLRGLLIGAAFVVFLVYAMPTLLNLQVQISDKANELDRIEQKIAVQEDKN